MERLIEELTENFKNSIPVEEERLCQAFNKYLLRAIENLKNSDSKFISKDDESISKVLKSIAERLTKGSLDYKKKELLRDKNFEMLSTFSMSANQMAEEILKGKKIEVKFDIDKRIEEMTRLSRLVEEYNKEEAALLLSEGILDLKYVKDPQTDIISLRLCRTARFLDSNK